MPADGLTVAITGPTGDLGVAIMAALERSRRVRRIVAMARRPVDPVERGWRKTEYHQGDVADGEAVRALVRGADVVVHLAFAVLSASDATRALNVEGSRNVFACCVGEGIERLLYASSVAAYGFHADNPDWLGESIPVRGSPEHPYSQHKAEVERLLAELVGRRPGTVAYVFRPCIVAGPNAHALLEQLPQLRVAEALPRRLTSLLAALPAVRPVLPDPGVRFQLVHEDDVARAFLAAVAGRGEPGAYNLAGPGTLSVGDLAHALGWYSLRVPRRLARATIDVATRVPGAPDRLAWLHTVRKPVLMSTQHARRELGWRPLHSGSETLAQMVAAYRAAS
jgi:UDP-glucose 4-epimerase